MKVKRIFMPLVVLALMLSVLAVQPASAGGFDEFGYNDVAGIFVGPADGVDRVLDGKVWGDPLYANDLLIMKWNSEWDRGNDENWSNPPYDAWENNEWNGAVPGGSGSVWHYKIGWVGDCAADPTLVPEGGYCIWGQFAVLMDQGVDLTSGPMHLWYAHASPAGYGAYP